MEESRKRGRPLGSIVRQNIVEILYSAGELHGYDIYKAYVSIFPKVTLRLIYYHLRKGVALGEFALKSIESRKGSYSWGDSAEKHYYTLGSSAKPKGDACVRKYFDGMRRLQ